HVNCSIAMENLYVALWKKNVNDYFSSCDSIASWAFTYRESMKLLLSITNLFLFSNSLGQAHTNNDQQFSMTQEEDLENSPVNYIETNHQIALMMEISSVE
ncbi:hypothetical protein ACJX0J_019716, partial [Zea mays]